MTLLHPPPAVVDERARARAVERLNIVGTGREQRFDRLTRLAQTALGAPIAYISVVDDDLLWFKSEIGLADPALPRRDTLCDHVIRSGSRIVVRDASLDDRFADLPPVLEAPHVRAYAGAPITDADGIPIGTFCVVDTEARDFTPEHLALLGELTEWARQELLDSSETSRARDVQQRLLPDRIPEPAGYRAAACCIPSASVGGDFFDAGRVGHSLLFSVADVMGKGTAAAILSATARTAIRSASRTVLVAGRGDDRIASLAEVMRATAETLDRDLTRTDTLITAFVARLDADVHRLTWADAGHGLAVLVGAAGTRWLSSADLPLGISASESWKPRTCDLGSGDRLLVFSDGLLDLLGGGRAQLGEVERMVREAPSADALVEEIRRRTRDGIAVDDVTAVTVWRAG